MTEDLRQALREVIEEWRKPLLRLEDILNRTDLTPEQGFALFKDVVVEATSDAFVALKLAHVLLLH